LDADKKSDREDGQTPPAAEMPVFVDEKVVSFHRVDAF
jgi:hypothetical protein